MDVSVLLTMHTDAALMFVMAIGCLPCFHSGKLEEDQWRKDTEAKDDWKSR